MSYGNNKSKQPLRALVVVELKSYIVILAPPKHKKIHRVVELNLFFLALLLQCTFIYYVHCSLELKKKKIIPYLIVCMAMMVVCSGYIILL